jgi:formate dehydrogenase alpha subunit
LEMIKLTIDGIAVETVPGKTVLEAARAVGIYIPTLCHHPDLEPYGGCRLCVVEIEKMRGLPAACTTPATGGMVVHTETPAVDNVRQTAVALLMADHEGDCLTCARNGNCELQQVAAYLGITRQPFRRTTLPQVIDTSNPFFELDRGKCILCARCVRTCAEVTGTEAIGLAYRGFRVRVATMNDGRLAESNCQSCGECVTHCPTGALALKETRAATREILTVCPYCGVGCEIWLGVRGAKIVSVRGKKDGVVERGGWLCVKGRFGISEFVHSPERLQQPLVRKNGRLEEVSWDEALDLVAGKLKGYRGAEIGVIASAKSTNEENYLLQKFTRAVLGTNNIDHCARLCHASTLAGLAQSFGAGAMTNSISEIGGAATILAIGTNTTEAHPVIGFEIKRAVSRGAKLIVINPREIDLVRHAALWLRECPGTDVALLMGMMRVIVAEGLADAAFIAQRCENYPDFIKSLVAFDLETVSRITGVPGEQITAAARLYATRKPAGLFYAMGITQHAHGTDNVIAIANLAMLTGNIGKPSTGVNPLRGQNNVQGACDTGCLPNVYTGYQPVAEAAARQKFEAAWDCRLPANPGLAVTEMIPAARDGKLKALYIIGENPVLSEPDANHAVAALKRLEFLVVQDIFLTETARLADVVLPAATFAEKEGTFTNTERRVQRVRPAIPPPGNALPDWLITTRLAARMGAAGFNYQHPEEIFREIARLTPSYGGISYARLEKASLQWPCPDPEHPGTPILHTAAFTRGKGKFLPLSYRPSEELPDAAYPFLLTTGRHLSQFHTGTMTRKVKGLNVLYGEESIEINPADAGTLGVAAGETVKVISRRGELKVRVKVSAVSPPGVVFMTFHFTESPANILTSAALDPMAKIPELKVAAVRIEKINDRI